MNQLLARCWWMLALLGMISLVFAFLALAWPGLTLLSLVVLFAAYALLAGVTCYGAAGSAVVVLVWIYYASMILFFGAKITQLMARSRGARIMPSAHAQIAK